MDALSKFRQQSSSKNSKRAETKLNQLVPQRHERLSQADVGLYDMVPEPARVQPVSDASIYRITPAKHR